MTSRKAKEQQAATSSNSLEGIKDLLNTKFSELGTRLTSLEEKLNNVTEDIHLKLNAVEATAQEASTYARENREEIEGLKFRLVELNEAVTNQAITIHQLEYARENREEIEGLKFRLAELNEAVTNQAITIHQLDIQVEDLKNRSLRKTLVFNTSLQKH